MSSSNLTTPTIPDLTQPHVFRLSPIIRLTLLLLYVSLTLPLPFLAAVTQAPIPPSLLTIGLIVGFGLLYAALTERVTVDEQSISVGYPGWIAGWRRGWSLQWSEIQALKPRSTGQGGIVYYFVSPTSDRAYLLPMRIAGFAQLVRIVEAKTGIDTRDVKPLAQPWMYLILLLLTLLLLAIDAWTITTALGQA